jgi:hypothetical protein
VVFYDVVMESSKGATTVGANIQRLNAGEFTTQFRQDMTANGVDASATNSVTASPSQQAITVTTTSEQGPFDEKNDVNNNNYNNNNNDHDDDESLGESCSDQRTGNPSSDDGNDTSPVGLILGILGGVLAVIGLIIVAVMYTRRHNKHRSKGASRLSTMPNIEIQMNPMEEKPSSADDSSIPCDVPGWEMLMDKGSGQAYYYNHMSGKTSWEKPPASTKDGDGSGADTVDDADAGEVDDWVEHLDPATGDKYYHSHKKSRTTWTEHMAAGGAKNDGGKAGAGGALFG